MRSAKAFLFFFVFAAIAAPAVALDWPQWFGPQRDGYWREEGILKAFPKEGPKVKWRMPIEQGYSGPAVVGDRVYVTDWVRDKDADGKPLKPTKSEGIKGEERALCLDASNGKTLWEHKSHCAYRISYPEGPRTTPVVEDGKVWTLGAMGELLCLNAADGKEIWSKSLTKEYGIKAELPGPEIFKPNADPKEQADKMAKVLPVWGYSASVLIRGDLLYTLAGGPGSAIVALDKNTGKEIWKALTSSEVGYVPPMVFDLAGKPQLIVWLSDSLNGLDPATGKVYWSLPYPGVGKLQRPEVNIACPRVKGNQLLVTSFYHGATMIEVAPGDPPTAKIVWQTQNDNYMKPDTLNTTMTTPYFKDDFLYGICGMGELRCLEANTGKQLWSSFEVAEKKKKALFGTAFLVPNGDRCFIWNDQGDLVLVELSPKEYKEIGRCHLLDPVQETRGRNVVWSHPAFAHKCMFARNFKEIICVDLAEGQ